ncbi:MAG: nitroreductase family protein [Eubacteriales bacterium]
MFKNLVLRNRSYRRFDHSRKIGEQTLRGWVDLARNTPSANNLQPLRYKIVTEEALCEAVFASLGWARSYLPEWGGPPPHERPAAYLVLFADPAARCDVDTGIAAQTILLSATEQGFGGCMFRSFQKNALCDALGIDPAQLVPQLVIAVGVPMEKVVLVPLVAGVKYYRGEDGTHYVPKRSLEDILL